jgi:hypothetical protein
MRARQRHFNAVHAGANTSLDGRFITGLADDASMSSWTGRAGSSLTPSQATSGNQPKYKTSAINGAAGVYFDDGGTAANGKFFEATTSVASNAISCIAVAQKTAAVTSSKYVRITSVWKSTDNTQALGDYATTNAILLAGLFDDTFGGFNPCATAFRNSAALAPTSYTVGNNIITSSVLDGTTMTFGKNGTMGTATTSATALSSDRWRVGAAPFVGVGADGNMRGYIVRVDLFLSSISASVRRRCEQSAAYSFKLASS